MRLYGLCVIHITCLNKMSHIACTHTTDVICGCLQSGSSPSLYFVTGREFRFQICFCHAVLLLTKPGTAAKILTTVAVNFASP